MTIDKSAWGAGPWQSEPDFERFEHLGVPCIMNRSPRSGGWCGYVAVPPGHPWHGKDYDVPEVDVHGGLTYANSCGDVICHVPKPGESDDVWWLGFDTAHGGDFSPKHEAVSMQTIGRSYGLPRDVYRTIAYVRQQTIDLAVQARRAQGWTTV